MDIGRNDLCPCGSGRKYKHCCLGDKKLEEIDWRKDNVEQYSTEKIISILQSIGIKINKEKFKNEVEKYYSAEDLTKEWFDEYDLVLEGKKQDFPWFAAMVLWDRLIDDNKSDDKLGDIIKKGWNYIEEEEYAKGCDKWLKVWQALKSRIKSEGHKSISELDADFKGGHVLFNWCQDLEINLLNAGKEKDAFHEKRAEYCNEFVELLPESSNTILRNMKKAEGESYFIIGEKEKGDNKFQRLIDEHPQWVWSYLGWGDMYNFELDKPEKAKKIYNKAYDVELESKDDEEMVKRRLNDVDKS